MENNLQSSGAEYRTDGACGIKDRMDRHGKLLRKPGAGQWRSEDWTHI